MSAAETGQRVSRARQAVDELIDIVHGEGPGGQAWYLMLLDIRDTLADSARPEEQKLTGAAEMFDALYSGPRNFSEFHVWRTDETERLAANQRLTTIIEELESALRG
jgi:hypothetical protein